MSVDDRYTIPGSGGVLKNLLGLTAKDLVDRAMNITASTEWSIVRQEPIPDRLDLPYLQSLHRRFFSPVLEWAGELRRHGDEVTAGDTGIAYARSMFFEAGLAEVFGQLHGEDYLAGLSGEVFAERLAERWGYLTMAHPFRDGNTRTQSAYVSRLADRAGHPIDWVRVDVDELRWRRLRAVAGSEAPLAEYLHARLLPATGPDRGGQALRLGGDVIADRLDAIALRRQAERGSSPTSRPGDVLPRRGPSR